MTPVQNAIVFFAIFVTLTAPVALLGVLYAMCGGENKLAAIVSLFEVILAAIAFAGVLIAF